MHQIKQYLHEHSFTSKNAFVWRTNNQNYIIRMYAWHAIYRFSTKRRSTHMRFRVVAAETTMPSRRPTRIVLEHFHCADNAYLKYIAGVRAARMHRNCAVPVIKGVSRALDLLASAQTCKPARVRLACNAHELK